MEYSGKMSQHMIVSYFEAVYLGVDIADLPLPQPPIAQHPGRCEASSLRPGKMFPLWNKKATLQA